MASLTVDVLREELSTFWRTIARDELQALLADTVSSASSPPPPLLSRSHRDGRCHETAPGTTGLSQGQDCLQSSLSPHRHLLGDSFAGNAVEDHRVVDCLTRSIRDGAYFGGYSLDLERQEILAADRRFMADPLHTAMGSGDEGTPLVSGKIQNSRIGRPMPLKVLFNVRPPQLTLDKASDDDADFGQRPGPADCDSPRGALHDTTAGMPRPGSSQRRGRTAFSKIGVMDERLTKLLGGGTAAAAGGMSWNGSLLREDYEHCPDEDGVDNEVVEYAAELVTLRERRRDKETFPWVWGPGCLTSFVRSMVFDYMVCALVMSSSLLIGVETAYRAQHNCSNKGAWIPFDEVSLAFCGLFSTELLLRVWAYGWAFWQVPDVWWNIFDTLVVISQISEEVVRYGISLGASKSGALGSSSSASNMLPFLRAAKALRLLRIARVARVVRVLHLIPELRMLLISIGASVKALVWTVSLLLLMTFMMAVFLAQLVAEIKEDNLGNGVEMDADLDLYFGTFDRAMLSLYQAASKGIPWALLVRPLYNNCHFTVVLAFCAYISFVLFAIMNVVTGMFVGSCIKGGEEAERRTLMAEMGDLFMSTDVADEGWITLQDFNLLMKNPRMKRCLKTFGLDKTDAQLLFDLLDTDLSGEIDHRDFVVSCAKMHGAAKAVDMRAVLQHQRRFIRKWEAHADLVERSMSYLAECQPMKAVGGTGNESRI
eukprot:TRINITY_DN48894_c0_g1_i1.p1 TRINITY_DN48894_c0_g1~~TRINITY_DN48894_c0_g1_i1.p1  ORF type:complete len:771 (-),score=104.12 TRINITY_DN48894_c0_g1_i1:85-2220(-)